MKIVIIGDGKVGYKLAEAVLFNKTKMGTGL